MAVTLNASTTAGLVQTADTSGNFSLQSNGTTTLAMTGSNMAVTGTISPQLAATASAPAYVKGAIYFDTTLNKLRVGGATTWETITSV